MVSRRIGRSVLSREIGAALAEFDLPILKASTTQRVIYADAMTAGRTVIEEQPHGAAAAEIRESSQSWKEWRHEQATDGLHAAKT